LESTVKCKSNFTGFVRLKILIVPNLIYTRLLILYVVQ